MNSNEGRKILKYYSSVTDIYQVHNTVLNNIAITCKHYKELEK